MRARAAASAGRDGAVGSGRQGLRRAGLPDARWAASSATTSGCYCDTPNDPTGRQMGGKLKEAHGARLHVAQDGCRHRPDRRNVPGRVTRAAGMMEHDRSAPSDPAAPVHRHGRSPTKGIEILTDYVAAGARHRRATTCPSPPITSATSASSTASAWARPWSASTWPGSKTWCPGSMSTRGCSSSARSTRRCCTGEDIYLHDSFKPLFDARAISVCHPDLATSGGICWRPSESATLPRNTAWSAWPCTWPARRSSLARLLHLA